MASKPSESGGDGKEKPGLIILKKLPKEKIAQLKNFQHHAINKPKGQAEQFKTIKSTLNLMGINKNMVLKPVTDLNKFKNLKNILDNHKELITLKPNQKFKIIGNVNKSPEKIQNKNTEIIIKQEEGVVAKNNSMPVPFKETGNYFKKTNVLAKPTFHCSSCRYASTSEPEIREHVKKHLSGAKNIQRTPEKVYTPMTQRVKMPLLINTKPVKTVPEKVHSVSTANLEYSLKYERDNDGFERTDVMEVDDVDDPEPVEKEPVLIQGKKLPLNKGLSRQNEISCSKCDFTAKHPLVFKIHMAEKHGDTKEKKQRIKDEKLQQLNNENDWDNFDDFFATPISTPPNKVLASPQKANEQSHLCFQCGYEAKFAEQLKKHEEKEHGADSVSEFKCQYCDWSSRNADKILFHLIHHPDQEVDEKIDTSILKKYGIIKV